MPNWMPILVNCRLVHLNGSGSCWPGSGAEVVDYPWRPLTSRGKSSARPWASILVWAVLIRAPRKVMIAKRLASVFEHRHQPTVRILNDDRQNRQWRFGHLQRKASVLPVDFLQLFRHDGHRQPAGVHRLDCGIPDRERRDGASKAL